MTSGPVLISSVDPSFVQGTDSGDTDRLAATAISEVQAFWRQNFTGVFGKPWIRWVTPATAPEEFDFTAGVEETAP